MAPSGPDVTPLRRDPTVNAMITAAAQQQWIKICGFIDQRICPGDYAWTAKLVQEDVTKNGRGLESGIHNTSRK
jgi:hypothetical protein